MAISRADVGVATVSGTGTLTPSYPASVSAGQLLVLAVGSAYPSVVADTPSGWTAPANNTKTGGAGSAGVDSGTRTAQWFYKIATGSESGTVSVTFSGGTPNLTACRIWSYQNATGAWDIACTGGTDNSPGATYSAAMDADPGIVSGDWCLTLSIMNTDSRGYAGETLTGTGITTALQAEFLDSAITNGDDAKVLACEFTVSAGPSSAAPTFGATATGSSANEPAGPTVLMRLREVSGMGSLLRGLSRTSIVGPTALVA